MKLRSLAVPLGLVLASGAILGNALVGAAVGEVADPVEMVEALPADHEAAGGVSAFELDGLERRIAALEARLGHTAAGRAIEHRDVRARYAELLGREQRLSATADSLLRAVPLGSPLDRGVVTSPYTPRRFHPVVRKVLPHWGLDIAAPEGVPVRAMADGTVAHRFVSPTYGIGVDVRHGDGAYITRYAHLSRTVAAQGEPVRKGQVIGYVGTTGRVTGPHLHLEIFARTAQGMVSRDPVRFLPADRSIRF